MLVRMLYSRNPYWMASIKASKVICNKLCLLFVFCFLFLFLFFFQFEIAKCSTEMIFSTQLQFERFFTQTWSPFKHEWHSFVVRQFIQADFNSNSNSFWATTKYSSACSIKVAEYQLNIASQKQCAQPVQCMCVCVCAPKDRIAHFFGPTKWALLFSIWCLALLPHTTQQIKDNCVANRASNNLSGDVCRGHFSYSWFIQIFAQMWWTGIIIL